MVLFFFPGTSGMIPWQVYHIGVVGNLGNEFNPSVLSTDPATDGQTLDPALRIPYNFSQTVKF